MTPTLTTTNHGYPTLGDLETFGDLTLGSGRLTDCTDGLLCEFGLAMTGPARRMVGTMVACSGINLLDVSPILPSHDLPNCAESNAVDIREFGQSYPSGGIALTDRDDLLISKASAVMSRSMSRIQGTMITAPSLGQHVGNVVSLSPKEEMRALTASVDVAPMAYLQSFRDRPISEFPDKTVGHQRHSMAAVLNPKSAIAVMERFSIPKSASGCIGACEMVPEASLLTVGEDDS